MIVYTSTRRGFLDDAAANRIHQRIAESFEQRHRRKVPPAEMSAWRNSMQFMATAVRQSDVPDDAGVSIEFGIPLSAKRIDFILSGRDAAGQEVAVIVELKQWSAVEVTDRDAIVRTMLGGALVGMLQRKREFVLIDDQKQVYERALALAESTAGCSEHEVLVVSGGPGTSWQAIRHGRPRSRRLRWDCPRTQHKHRAAPPASMFRQQNAHAATTRHE